ncbi:hypothetical protein [Sandarakinorhabdus sp.]|uniref:hypothetical protein n=1 Tax=Sandarakinorhabdus sp. TaxID=1916663 RepID=UPI00333E91F8
MANNDAAVRRCAALGSRCNAWRERRRRSTSGRVEAHFDPISFEKLYVEQRGKILFKKG